jgi:hypothetical protein
VPTKPELDTEGECSDAVLLWTDAGDTWWEPEAGAHLTGETSQRTVYLSARSSRSIWSDVPFPGSLPGPCALLEPQLGSSAPRKRDHGPYRLAHREP